MTTDCLFCKIRDGHIPAAVTHRDDHVFAFKDIAPKAPFHQLVVPLRHVARLADAEPGTPAPQPLGARGRALP
jgi:histidine triad (HIT) family protein